MDYLDLAPIGRVRGTVRLPGSKSISNRILLLAALAQGETLIHGLLEADDTRVMVEALRALGVDCQDEGGGEMRVRGAGGAFAVKRAELFLGNAGTVFRPLTAVLALCGGDYRLSGVARMEERPIADLVDALRRLGAEIEYLGKEGYPPLAIRPGAIRAEAGVSVRGSVSSQFLTALLIALPLAGTRRVVTVEGDLISKPYVEITLNTARRFGVEIAREGWHAFTVPAKARYVSPGEIHVEGDASSASYFLAAGAISGLKGGGPVRVEGVGRASIQGDVRFTEVLRRMGAQIAMGDNWIEAGAGQGAIGRGKLEAIDADFNHIPDAAMTAAVAALFADGTSTLRNIGSWRVKETDRIAAMATELRKLGAAVEEGPDYLRITPPRSSALAPHAAIATYDDHRMAMSFSLVAAGGVPVRINDPRCVSKTFPEYFDVLAAISESAGSGSGEFVAGRPATTPAPPVIAIDGPSASGKGTVAQAVAATLGFHYLNSGALYRTVALAAERAGVSYADEPAVAAVASRLRAEFRGQAVTLEGSDITDLVHTEAVGAAASRLAAIPAVREALLDRQRAFRRPPGLVADGRDMGSVVFPDAALKIFLTASPEERAARRHKQLIEKGMRATMAALLQDIRARDARDSERGVAPLRRCADAVLLDTTGMPVEEVIAQVLAQYRLALRAP